MFRARRLSNVAVFIVVALLTVVGLESGASAATPGNPNAGCHPFHQPNQGQGANQPGPYDPTCTGAPSMNGGGAGKATGRPCAGCVGNADAKNPPGQLPGPSDRNAGYECDRNQGIARTNPAHTGCTVPPPPPPPPPCTHNCGPPPPCTQNCSPPPPCTQNCSPPPPPCTQNCSPPPPPCTQNCSPPPPCTQNCSAPPLFPGLCDGHGRAYDPAAPDHGYRPQDAGRIRWMVHRGRPRSTPRHPSASTRSIQPSLADTLHGWSGTRRGSACWNALGRDGSPSSRSWSATVRVRNDRGARVGAAGGEHEGDTGEWSFS